MLCVYTFVCLYAKSNVVVIGTLAEQKFLFFYQVIQKKKGGGGGGLEKARKE